VAKVIPESSFKFFANDFFKGVIIKDRDNVRVHERLLAGSLAGVTAQTCIYPLEVVKTRIAIAPQGT
jgi:solute carrier family 25 phosphate transporter 23/24/25/41